MSMAKTEVVMDTNVAVVANGMTEQAGQTCVAACIVKLRKIVEDEKLILLLDDKYFILDEYRNNLSLSGQPGYGDFFIQWLWESHTNKQYCRMIPVTPHEDREFKEFPNDPSLASFDQDDRKFVAVALASGSSPQVLNASDTDWWHHRESLCKHGVEVAFLCPELMTRGR